MAICAFTGHRPHTMRLPQDELSPAILALKKDMEAAIDDLILNRGVTRFISGAALGTDLWICEMVLKRMEDNPALELEIAIPFIGQTEKWTKSNMSKFGARYDDVVGRECVIQEYQPDPSFLKNKSYQRRNFYMAEKCDYLLAVWNGSWSGTGMTVKMAQKLGKNCIIIDPKKFRALVDTEKF